MYVWHCLQWDALSLNLILSHEVTATTSQAFNYFIIIIKYLIKSLLGA